VSSFAFLLVFFLVGLPLVRWATGRFRPAAIALAPAVGAGIVTLAAVVLITVLH
jgi:hypothetical protein